MGQLDEILSDILEQPPNIEDTTISFENHVQERQTELQPEVLILERDAIIKWQEKLDKIQELTSAKNYVIERGYITRNLAQESFASLPWFSPNNTNIVTKLTELPSKVGINLVTQEFDKEIENFSKQAELEVDEIRREVKKHIEIIRNKKILNTIRFTIPIPQEKMTTELTMLIYSIRTGRFFKSHDDFYENQFVQADIDKNYPNSEDFYYTEEEQERLLERLETTVSVSRFDAFERAFCTIDNIYKIYNKM